jgi:hypothetical protein
MQKRLLSFRKVTSQPRAGNIFPDLFSIELAVGVTLFTMRWAVKVWTSGRINFILRRSFCGAGTGYALVCLEKSEDPLVDTPYDGGVIMTPYIYPLP